MNYSVRYRGSLVQAIEILEITSMILCSPGVENLGCCIGTGEAKDLISRLDQILNDQRSNKTCCAGNKDAHLYTYFNDNDQRPCELDFGYGR